MPAPRNDALALARFVLAPTKATNARSLDQQWGDLAGFLRGPASALARWLAVAQMHSVYRQMRVHKSHDERKLRNLTIGHFVERACAATGLSRPTLYAYVDRSRALVEALGPAMLKEMLSGKQRIANDENLLIKVAQLPPEKAVKVVQTYMRGGKGEAAAARLVERYLHDHRLSALSTHEPRLRGGSLIDGKGNGETSDARNVVLFGDALVHLRESIPAESVQCCVTSPPFYGQRDFGTRHWFGGDSPCKHDRKVAHGPFRGGDVAQAKYKTSAASETGQKAITHSCSKCGGWHGQLGQEPDLGMYIQHIVTVFGAVRRVLREDGVCWIEIGDTYNAGTNALSPDSRGTDVGNWQRQGKTRRRRSNAPGLAAKSLMLVPQRLAVALQADGWIVRSEIIVHKLAPLPESCTDRPTRSHTTILMLAKGPDYFYDHVAIMEPAKGVTHSRGDAAGTGRPRKWAGYAQVGTSSVSMRNCRDVWSFPLDRFPDAHTATFPRGLPERCVKASTSERGACAMCGAPWRRRTHQARVGGNVRRDGSVAPVYVKGPGTKFMRDRMRAGRLASGITLPMRQTIGWEPTCECGTSEIRPCIVLDPFAGSGTTLMVAKQLKRDYLGIEINEREYRPLIERRLAEAGRPHEQRTRRAARTSANRS